jgi:hypothetical protein
VRRTRGDWEKADPTGDEEKNPGGIELFRDAEGMLDAADPSGRSSGGKGRFYEEDTWTWGGVGHGLSNVLYGQGTWSYRSVINPWTLFSSRASDKTTGIVRPAFTSKKRPSPSAAMGNVAAWKYAADSMWMPPKPESGDDYEWCHLWAHGFGGATDAANLVAGSHACNSVMCAIEQWIISHTLKNWAMPKRVWFQVSARLATGAPHLAETITYSLYRPGDVHGEEFYSYRIDARRAVEPSKEERRRIIDGVQSKYDE